MCSMFQRFEVSVMRVRSSRENSDWNQVSAGPMKGATKCNFHSLKHS